MEELTIDTFIPMISQFANKDLLTPLESSRLGLIITEGLIDHKVDLPTLKFLSRFLTPESYDDIVEERNIEHQCGYILCDQSPKQLIRRLSNNSNGTTVCQEGETKFQIYNRKPSIVLPNTYSSQYCCKDHYQASIFYRNQISHEAIFARKDIMIASPFPQDYPGNWYENGITCLEEVLAAHRQLKDQGKTLADVIQMMNGLSVGDENNNINNVNNNDKDTSELIKLIQDFEILEKEGGLIGDVDEDAEDEDESAILDDNSQHRNVDGYVTSKNSYVV